MGSIHIHKCIRAAPSKRESRQRTNLTPIFSLSGFQLFPVRSTFDSLPIMFNLAALFPAGDAGNTTKAEIDEAP